MPVGWIIHLINRNSESYSELQASFSAGLDNFVDATARSLQLDDRGRGAGRRASKALPRAASSFAEKEKRSNKVKKPRQLPRPLFSESQSIVLFHLLTSGCFRHGMKALSPAAFTAPG